jgi:hypothetical protein
MEPSYSLEPYVTLQILCIKKPLAALLAHAYHNPQSLTAIVRFIFFMGAIILDIDLLYETYVG